MFRKREKKLYPPGTFIPMPARVCAIIQLCLAFTIVLWNLAQPFAGELFSVKSKLILYQDVMGTVPQQQELSPEKRARLERNAERFAGLPENQKEIILTGLQGVQKELQRSFFDKSLQALHILFFEIPPFEQAWLILSFIIPIMLLKRIEGAAQAVWLLPLLAALYAFDNRWHAHVRTPTEDVLLFPTEQVLVEKFLDEPLSASIFEQQKQLQQAWKMYLINIWDKQTPSNDLADANLQAERGEFAFNLARLEHIAKDRSRERYASNQTQDPLAALSLYFFWNALFACIVWKYAILRDEPS